MSSIYSDTPLGNNCDFALSMCEGKKINCTEKTAQLTEQICLGLWASHTSHVKECTFPFTEAVQEHQDNPVIGSSVGSVEFPTPVQTFLMMLNL